MRNYKVTLYTSSSGPAELIIFNNRREEIDTIRGFQTELNKIVTDRNLTRL